MTELKEGEALKSLLATRDGAARKVAAGMGIAITGVYKGVRRGDAVTVAWLRRAAATLDLDLRLTVHHSAAVLAQMQADLRTMPDAPAEALPMRRFHAWCGGESIYVDMSGTDKEVKEHMDVEVEALVGNEVDAGWEEVDHEEPAPEAPACSLTANEGAFVRARPGNVMAISDEHRGSREPAADIAAKAIATDVAEPKPKPRLDLETDADKRAYARHDDDDGWSGW